MLFIISISNAQSHFYLNTTFGFGFDATSDDLGSPFSEIGELDYMALENGSILVRPIFGTVGSGMKISLGPGFQINNHVALEMLCSYTKSGNIQFANFDSPTYKANHSIETNRFVLNPQLKLMTGDKLKLFTKTGLLLPITGNLRSFVSIDDDEGRLAYEQLGIDLSGIRTDVLVEAISSANFSLGFKQSIGIEYALIQNLFLHLECSYNALNVPIEKTTIEVFQQSTYLNDVLFIEDSQETLPIYELKTIYLSELTDSSNNQAYNENYDENLPLEELIFKTNYSNISINLGIRYTFDRKIEADKLKE